MGADEGAHRQALHQANPGRPQVSPRKPDCAQRHKGTCLSEPMRFYFASQITRAAGVSAGPAHGGERIEQSLVFLETHDHFLRSKSVLH